jgi:hypothetical protein
VKVKVLIILGALTIILSGCVQPLVYKLEPMDEKEFYKGREIVTKGNDSTSVSVEVDNYDAGRVMFYVQFKNNSDSKIFIEPVNYYVDVISEDLKTINTLYPRYYAADPEKEINNINRDIENRKNSHSFLTGANAVLAFINVAADLSDKNDKHKADHVGDDINVWANNQTDENIDYNNSLNDLSSKKEYWKNQALRKTDLYQGEQVGGIVVVSTNPEAEYLEFSIPLEDNVYNFLFKKIIVE